MPDATVTDRPGTPAENGWPGTRPRP